MGNAPLVGGSESKFKGGLCMGNTYLTPRLDSRAL